MVLETYISELGAIRANAKIDWAYIRERKGSDKHMVAGPADTDVMFSANAFEIMLERREGDDVSMFLGGDEIERPDGYILGLSVVNNIGHSGQTEADFWASHGVVGLVGTIARGQDDGTSSTHDTIPAILSGLSNHHYTGSKSCRRGQWLRARVPASTSEAEEMAVIHSANPAYPQGRYLAYADPVDMETVGWNGALADQLRNDWASAAGGKREGLSPVWNNQATREMWLGMMEGSKQMALNIFAHYAMLKASKSGGARTEGREMQALRANPQLLDQLSDFAKFLGFDSSKGGDDRDVLRMNGMVNQCLAPRPNEEFSLGAGRETLSAILTEAHKEGATRMANSLQRMRFHNLRTVFMYALSGAAAGSGDIIDGIVQPNPY